MKDYTSLKIKAANLLLSICMIFAVFAFIIPPQAQASRPDWAGNGNDKGSSGSGTDKGDLYGDLLIIVRNNNGEPILYHWEWDNTDPNNPIYIPIKGGNCEQPIANEEGTKDDGTPLDPLPDEFSDNGLKLIPLNDDCDIIDTTLDGYADYPFANYAEEIDMGRLSVARSPVDVINSSYTEAMTTINSAKRLIKDPAGRIVAILDDDTEQTIDSPLENLALYNALMTYGHLPTLTLTNEQLGEGELVDMTYLKGVGTSKESLDTNDLNTAAALLAGAGDKYGKITLDLVITVNTILGLNDPDYFNFVGYNYSYNRNTMFTSAQTQLLLPELGTTSGSISSLVCRTVGILSATPAVFMDNQDHEVQKDDVDVYYARGFTQAADDALQVIYYIHNWSLPELPEDLEWSCSN